MLATSQDKEADLDLEDDIEAHPQDHIHQEESTISDFFITFKKGIGDEEATVDQTVAGEDQVVTQKKEGKMIIQVKVALKVEKIERKEDEI
jgi:hypothetical protein